MGTEESIRHVPRFPLALPEPVSPRRGGRGYPVLRESRHAVGELLRQQAMPAVMEWLRESGTVGWESRRHSIEFTFNPAENALSVTQVDGVLAQTHS